MSAGSRDSVRITTRGATPSISASRRTRSMPLPSARRRSARTRSGWVRAATSAASLTLDAAPTTVRPPASSTATSPRRKSGWSSTTTMRTCDMLPLYGGIGAGGRLGDHRDLIQRMRNRHIGLGDPHPRAGHAEPGDEVVGDHGGEPLQEPVRASLGKLDDPIAHRGVVDRVGELIRLVGPGGRRVEPDVEHERLPLLALLVEHAVIGEHPEAADLDPGAPHEACSIAAATASASRVSRTSCTRTIQAPRRTASTFAAAVATARLRSASPMIAPRNRLRDTPITTGGPTATIASRRRSTERL